MIDRQHGRIVFECDSCDEVLETGERDFQIAWTLAQEDGWTSRKIGGDWQHSCPNCGAAG